MPTDQPLVNPSARAEFIAGIKAFAPILPGILPSGMVNGAAAVSAGIPPHVALTMSPVIFAGVAQLIVPQLLNANTSALVILLAASIVNFRLLLYSLSLAPHLAHLPARWRGLLAYLITDTAYALTIAHLHRQADDPLRHWFMLGAGLAMWSAWQVSTALGVLLGSQLPANWSLDFIIVLTFIAIIAPLLRDRATFAVSVTAAVIATLTVALPFRIGLLGASLLGILVGLWVESKTR